MVLKNLAAHRKRNQMTGLIYSLSLGFLLFLSISCRMQINVSSQEQLKERASYFVVRTKDSLGVLPLQLLEQIMAMNNHIIEEFSWVTAPLNKFEDSYVIRSGINDHQQRSEMEQEFHGIMPNYFEATIAEFTDEFNDYEAWD